MLTCSNPTSAKPIEERVRGLICRQLMLRVYDDDRIFINKADYVELLCLDIVALARAGGDIDAALAIAVEMQPHYAAGVSMKAVELQGASIDYPKEINAYREYLDASAAGEDDERIFERVLDCFDYDLLSYKIEGALKARLRRSLSPEIDEIEAFMAVSRVAKAVRLIAMCDSDREIMQMINEESDAEQGIDRQFFDAARKLPHAIAACKTAMRMYEQDAEIDEVIAKLEQTLMAD